MCNYLCCINQVKIKSMNNTEKIVSFINSNIFFKEFTFSRNEFITPDGKSQFQLADNVVWLDDILFIYQIKDRNSSADGSETKWFESKVQKKAVKQIKGSLGYIKEYEDITITNERGHCFNICEANLTKAKKIIVYTSTDLLPEEKRLLKFHRSRAAGLIHLFHSEDYKAICRFLFTPSEINEYLSFRENLYEKHEQILNSLPEQYVLAHFLETIDSDNIDLAYLDNLLTFQKNESEFDILFIIDLFKDKIMKYGNDNDYYLIIKEIAKLNRVELKGFKARFKLSLEKAESQAFVKPYRMSSISTGCGFVFIPLQFENSSVWKNALLNLTIAHKYEQILKKCVGMIVCHNQEQKLFDINWSYIENDWVYNEELEQLLIENNPFRKVSLKKESRYFFKK